MKKNKGFSLVELVVVVAIMAVLMGILIPTLVRNVNQSKRSVDVEAAGEWAHSIQRTLTAGPDLYYTFVGDEAPNYSFSWNSGTSMDSFKNDKLVSKVLGEFSYLPVSKWDKSLTWLVNINGDNGDVHIYLVNSVSDTKGYELYPDHSTYIKKNKKKDIVF